MNILRRQQSPRHGQLFELTDEDGNVLAAGKKFEDLPWPTPEEISEEHDLEARQELDIRETSW